LRSETFSTMFDNLALACRQMLRGPHGRALLPDRGISVLYGAPPAAIDLIMVSFQNHDCSKPLFDPTRRRPWPEQLVHTDEGLDPFPFGERLRRVFEAHGLMRTLRERTLGVNAIYPDAPVGDAEFWLCGEGSYGAWRRFSTSWTGMLIEQIQPRAVLLLGRKAALAMRDKLGGAPAVEAINFATATTARDDSVYDLPFGQLAELLGRGR
jgi:hypothetical protein